jgi:hypothetical protein
MRVRRESGKGGTTGYASGAGERGGLIFNRAPALLRRALCVIRAPRPKSRRRAGGAGRVRLAQGSSSSRPLTHQPARMLGSINFFNIDGIKNGSNAVGAAVAKNSRTKCIVSSIVDNRSDYWVNRGSRVEQPFHQAYAVVLIV